MKTKSNGIFVFILAIVISTGIIASASLNLSVFAQNATQTAQNATQTAQNANFTANLSGQEEIPPVQTTANGTAIFSPSGNSMEYIVDAGNIQNHTAGHIHLAPPGQNGPVVVTLFNLTSPQNQFFADGDPLTADNLEGPMQGQQLTDLISEMNNGNTYVNIHTTQNPNGEIRGQIIPSNQ